MLSTALIGGTTTQHAAWSIIHVLFLHMNIRRMSAHVAA
jgi:hypothetical protein